jgi:hypothetical protein
MRLSAVKVSSCCARSLYGYHFCHFWLRISDIDEWSYTSTSPSYVHDMRRANVTLTVTLRSFDVALGNVFILFSGPGWRSQYSDITGWTVRGSNPGRGNIFRARPDRSWGPRSLLYNGYRVILWGKPAVRLPLSTHLPYSAEIKEGVELYLYPSVPSWKIAVWTSPFILFYGNSSGFAVRDRVLQRNTRKFL